MTTQQCKRSYIVIHDFWSFFCKSHYYLFIQISYTVDPALSSRYHAHADGDLLVLLDVTPSQEMVDEGIAREVINKIQKLRKKVDILYNMYSYLPRIQTRARTV
jgi:hypothetical protein